MKTIKQWKHLITFLLLAAALPLGANGLIAVGISGQETPLNPFGQPFELFRDDQGRLWVSDYWAGEIWRVDPETGAYSIFTGLYGASDGRTDAASDLWWSDLEAGSIGRLTPGKSEATVWTLGEDAGPLGIAFGDNGQVWIADAVSAHVFRFAPSDSQLCTYAIPNKGTADYLIFIEKQVWLGDPTLGRIVRLDPANNVWSIWQLPPGSYPQGLAFDTLHRIWWADPGRQLISSLDPADGSVNSYAVPEPGGAQAKPVSVAVQDDQIWYADQNGRIGQLNPSRAALISSNISPVTSTSGPACSAIAAGKNVPVGQKNGQLSWTKAGYSLPVNSAGWRVYSLPEGAAPWGLAVNGSDVWFTDQGFPGVRAPQLGWIDSTDMPGSSTQYLPVVIAD